MPIRIFTIPYNPQTIGFADEELQKFLLNKNVKSLHPQFFQLDGMALWTVFVEYEVVVSRVPAESDGLNAPERLLYQRLREWRKETAEKEGVPVFIIANNKQLMELIKQSPTTLEALRNVHGFGKKKVEAYGAALTGLIKAFNKKEPLHGPKPSRERNEQEAANADA